MALRERARTIRKKFSRGSSSTSGASGASSEVSSTMGDDHTPVTTWQVYKPGERIPYKYRRPVDKAHKEKLESFCFSTAWCERRKSFASQYSPMGSRIPSRRNSIEMHMGGHSMHLRRSDTGNLTESSDEGSTPANVSLSRRTSHDRLFANIDDGDFLSPGDLSESHPRSRHNTPFTAQDLTLALQRSRLSIPS